MVEQPMMQVTHGLTALQPVGGMSPMSLAIKLGVIHALVDAACGAIVYAEVAPAGCRIQRWSRWYWCIIRWRSACNG